MERGIPVRKIYCFSAPMLFIFKKLMINQGVLK